MNRRPRLRVDSAGGPSSGLLALRNLGPASVGWLEAVGIRTPAELRAVGAVEAFRRVAVLRSGSVSLNLLYALEGALRDVPWDAFGPEERAAMRRAVE